MHKYKILGIIIFTSFLPIILALLFFNDEAYNFLWSLLFIPGFLIIITYPKRAIAIITILGYICVEIFTQYYFLDIGDSSAVRLKVLIMNPLVNAIILFSVAYYRIKVKIMTDQLHDLVIHDPLTGIYNRRYFDLFLESSVSEYEKSGKSFQLIYFDIDHFKMINDQYGHPCGDHILKGLTRIINNQIRGLDIFFRIGGEEFAIFLPETSIKTAESVANRLRRVIDETSFDYNCTPIKVTISIGIAQYNGEEIQKLINRVDSALYRAKTNGRNQVVVFE
ncbi:GGDEF domain-containing protein [Lederbergia wuyishanensis]|uniref:Two-component system cell cycle response regulator n=1 Tax=Lederbergia wuyishanensis TaxID=1347903 RepID=A0ABU0D9Q1_9BACI|nr:GGDEF domain-containing protein [Lederbergia wuyishanensis]MCJ8007409.1 GGDEF domain-containing protein [Lederbergia wuyishanensis]MDQ0345153.1 two-component system cell cycle response regulator [Lederbergia wuyishanensis]